MAIFRCKTCGANLDISEDTKVVKCEHCENLQTVPSADDEKKINLFNRANDLRFKCEFDKAAGIYETIVSEYPNEAEGYWGLCLCKYGIEYIDDIKTGKKIPTCHRTLPTSIMDDTDFERAYENADIIARDVYRDEAKAIDRLQKQIFSIVEKETPYDVFICYKETDDITKSQTEDSQIAQDIYTRLLERGYKVFFAKQTLKARAGTEYEPYIYAALRSAKVMLAIGTKFAYYDAVWVKNEWSRYLEMMANDSSKHLIPCFKNLDAYDIPKEFKNLQALDMADTMFSDNLMQNIERFIPRTKEPQKEIVYNDVSGRASPLLERAFMFLADRNWQSADEYCEKVLDLDPKNARAYLGKLMAELKHPVETDLESSTIDFENNINYQKALRFSDSTLSATLKNYLAKSRQAIADRIAKKKEEAEKLRLEQNQKLYEQAKQKMNSAKASHEFLAAAMAFERIKDFLDSAALAMQCREKVTELQRIKNEKEAALARKQKEMAIEKANEEAYNVAKATMNTAKSENAYREAANKFRRIPDWKDSSELLRICEHKAEKLKELRTKFNNTYPEFKTKKNVSTLHKETATRYNWNKDCIRSNLKSLIWALPLNALWLFLCSLSRGDINIVFIIFGLLSLLFGIANILTVFTIFKALFKLPSLKAEISSLQETLNKINSCPTFEEFCKSEGFEF